MDTVHPPLLGRRTLFAFDRDQGTHPGPDLLHAAAATGSIDFSLSYSPVDPRSLLCIRAATRIPIDPPLSLLLPSRLLLPDFGIFNRFAIYTFIIKSFSWIFSDVGSIEMRYTNIVVKIIRSKWKRIYLIKEIGNKGTVRKEGNRRNNDRPLSSRTCINSIFNVFENEELMCDIENE